MSDALILSFLAYLTLCRSKYDFIVADNWFWELWIYIRSSSIL